ncbi:MAG: hypothetical protein K0M45_10010 [Candidatus Paracaedibacteraceae bacterium]|nr:hypothetical protein [Candidatus Paracaedibacteraceae bacterium]
MLRIWKFENGNPYHNRAYDACRRTANKLEEVKPDSDLTEKSFLQKDFGSPLFDKLPIEGAMIPIMQRRYKEAYNCLVGNSPLAVIILCGSILEGILLGIALKQPLKFTQSSAAPRDSKENKVKPLEKWTLENLINVSYNISILGKDISKFSHALRDFRNYIHPYQQMSSQFDPDKHTAKICFQVLVAAIYDLSTTKLD